MRILLHGATNCGSSNLGDFLYGDVIYTYLTSRASNVQVDFSQPSKYFEKNIKGYNKQNIKVRDIDLLIYIPGGYFGETHKARFRDNLVQFIRFFPVGLLAVVLRKKIVIIGIGAGPISSKLLRLPISIICKYAEVLTVRDVESYNALRNIGVKNIIVGSDMILSIDYSEYKRKTRQLNDIETVCTGKKKLLVHYNHSILSLKKFAEAVNNFIQANEEYQIIVTSDQLLKNENELFQEFSGINKSAIHYLYDSADELIALLNEIDLVLTCKLHVGVVASCLSKSVVCVAEHPEKTQRYYKSIGESDRCISVYDATVQEIVAMLEQYKELPIVVPKSEINNSQIHWDILKKVIDEAEE